MFFKLRPFLGALIFLGGLELLVYSREFVFWISGILLFLAALEGKKAGQKWSFAVLPAFFTLSSAALLYLITIPYEQHIFIVLSATLYYLAVFGAYRLGNYLGDKTALAMNMTAGMAALFFSYTSIYGLYLNFLVPLFALMAAYFLVTLLVSYQYFSLLKTNKEGMIWVYCFLLALVMGEIIWTMNFWPFGYLTTGVIALMLYYIVWDLTQGYFLDILSRRRVTANLVFFSLMIAWVLLTSKWIPVI